MKGSFVALAVPVALLVLVSGGTFAQVGVGIKVPPLIPPEVFVALHLSDSFLLEGGVILSLGGAFGLDAAAKLYLGALELGEGFALRPFIGAGGAAFGFAGGLGSAVVVRGLGGVEYGLPETPFSLFAEFGVGLALAQVAAFGASSLSVGGALGARMDF